MPGDQTDGHKNPQGAEDIVEHATCLAGTQGHATPHRPEQPHGPLVEQVEQDMRDVAHGKVGHKWRIGQPYGSHRNH